MEDMQPRPPLQPAHQGESNGLGVASMVIGIVSVLLAIIPIIGFVSWLLAPLAIILGIIGLNKPGKGFAITGLVTGGLGLLICLAWVALFATGASLASEIEQQAREDYRSYDTK